MVITLMLVILLSCGKRFTSMVCGLMMNLSAEMAGIMWVNTYRVSDRMQML
jgi:hypothetical protein